MKRWWLVKIGVIGVLTWASSEFLVQGVVPNRPQAETINAAFEKSADKDERSDSLLFILNFSGGGTRSAALSFGVLRALRDISIQTRDGSHRALDEVDRIYAVSGGAFTAAYYGLHGDAVFTDLEPTFLKRNLNIDFPLSSINLHTLKALIDPKLGRSEAMIRYLDKLLFNESKVSELLDDKGPLVEISASDLTSGAQFAFSRYDLNNICSDPASISVARAITATSAVPILYSPVPLRNYADQCGDTGHDLTSLAENILSLSYDEDYYNEMKRRLAYADTKQHRYLHLADGGLADNTGLRSLLAEIYAAGGLTRYLQQQGLEATRHIVLIDVDAGTQPAQDWGAQQAPLDARQVMLSATAMMFSRYSRETIDRIKATFDEWKSTSAASGNSVDFNVIHIGFDNLPGGQREELNTIPTNFALPPQSVDRVVNAGDTLLKQNAQFRQWVYQWDDAEPRLVMNSDTSAKPTLSTPTLSVD